MYLSTPAIMPRTSTDAPPAAEVARKNRRSDGLELAAFRARQAVNCASTPTDFTGNLAVDAGIASKQLAATLPRQVKSFVSADDNAALPSGVGSELAPTVIPVDGSGNAIGAIPEVWPQTIDASSALIRRMQVQKGNSGCATVGTRPRYFLPCGVSPGWGQNLGPGVSQSSLSASGILSWIRNNAGLSVGIAALVAVGISQTKGRRR